MLVTNSESINRYVADGVVKIFPLTFQFLDNNHVAVYRYENDALVKVDKSEYSIHGAGSELGGQCEFNVVPLAGVILAFIRDVPITQLTQYSELDNFPAESHENALTKLTMICQMLAESLTRAVLVQPTSTETPGELAERIFDARDRAETAAVATAVSEGAAASSAMASAASATNSDASANLAEQWASSPHGSVVENGEYSAKHYAEEAKNAVPDNLVERVGAVEAKTLPATTTARGIARVATLADMEPGAVIENGPAFLAAGLHTSVSAAAGKIPVADANGRILSDWLLLAAPTGMLGWWPSDTPPPGWLERNGAAISRAAHPKLFAALGTRYGAGDGTTTFNLSDDRGYAIRGWDRGRGVDSGRALGSKQADNVKYQSGAMANVLVDVNAVGSGIMSSTSVGARFAVSPDGGGGQGYKTLSIAFGAGTETVMKNAAYMPIIKDD